LYETLQVPAHADPAAIEAVFAQLSSQYDPAKFRDVAPELRDLAATRYAAIAAAYATLHDPAARAAYDAQLATDAASSAEIDYRPLPPRRASPAAVRPITPIAARSSGWLNGWLVLAATLALALVGTAVLVWSGTRPAPAASTANMPLFAAAIIAEIPDQATRDQILSLDAVAAQGRAALQQTPNDPNLWAFLGNAHFDFIQTIYESAPDGEAYAQNLSRWLEASEAYSQSLSLDPVQPLVRSDRALALIRYGLGFDNRGYIAEGLAEADRAIAEDDQTLQVVLNVGRAYALARPPRTADARRLWQRVIELAPTSPQATQAQSLLDGGTP
jgi:tetratricopeptide (TPR) repeat protein